MTTILIILAFLSLGAAVYCVLKGFNDTCLNQFKHDFLSRNIVIALTFAILVSLYGYISLIPIPKSGVSINALIVCWLMMATAPIFAIWLVAYNIRKTGFFFGTIGSVLQIIVLPVVAIWKILVAALKIMWNVFCDSANSKPTYERDNSEEEHQKMLQQDTQETSASYRFKNDPDSLY